MSGVFYLFMLLVLVNSVFGATIHGSVYDLHLDKMEDVVVEIDTEPKQQFISKDGLYTFDVSEGEYTIMAKYSIYGIIESMATEEISVKADGDFILDLILFPVVETELIDKTEEINVENGYFDEGPNYLLIGSVVLLVFVLLFLIYLFKTSKKLKKENINLEKTDDYLNKVLELIKTNKRITQKDIRKQIPLSEGKISLIITELESKGLTEKIKKGRGNILISKK